MWRLVLPPPPPSFFHDSPHSMSINPCLMDSKRRFCLLLYYVFINELTIGFMDIYTVLLSLLRNKGLFKVKVSEKGVCIFNMKNTDGCHKFPVSGATGRFPNS